VKVFEGRKGFVGGLYSVFLKKALDSFPMECTVGRKRGGGACQ